MFTKKGLITLASYFGIVNVGAAGLFYYDKQQAIERKWRVRESTLQLTALFGGWIGGCWAMEKFKHKRAKQSFKNVYFTAVAGNVGIIGASILVFKKFPHLIPYQIRSFLIKDSSNYNINNIRVPTKQYQEQQPQKNQKFYRNEPQHEQQNFEIDNLNNKNKRKRGKKNKQN